MANYNVDIEVALRGAQDLRQFNKSLRDTTRLVGKINGQIIATGKANKVTYKVASIDNYRKAVDRALRTVNKAALGTQAHKDAVENLVKAKKQLQDATDDQKKLFDGYADSLGLVTRKTNAATNATKRLATAQKKVQGPTSPIRGAAHIPGSPINLEQRAKARGAAVTAGAFPLLFGGGAFQSIGGAIGGGLTGNMFGGATVAFQVLGSAVDSFAGKAVQLGQSLNPVTADIGALNEAVGISGTEAERAMDAFQQLAGEQAALEIATQRLANLVGYEGVDALRTFGSDTQALSNAFAKAMTIMQAALADFINSTGILRSSLNTVERGILFNVATRSKDPEQRKRVEAFRKASFTDMDEARRLEAIIVAEQRRLELKKEAAIKADQEKQSRVKITTVENIETRILKAQKSQKEANLDLTTEQGFALAKAVVEHQNDLELQQAINNKTSIQNAMLKGELRLKDLINRQQKQKDALAKKAAAEALKTANEAERERKKTDRQNEQDQRAAERANEALDKINRTYTNKLALQAASTELEAEMLKIDQRRAEVLIKIEKLRSQKGVDPEKADAAIEAVNAAATSASSGIFGDLGDIADMPSFASSIEMSNSLLLTQEEQIQKLIEKYPLLGQAADAAANMMTFGIQSFVDGTKTAEEVFADFLRSIADMLMRTAQQMIAQYIVLGVARAFGLGTTPSIPSFQSGIDAGLPSFGDYSGMNLAGNFGGFRADGGSVSSGRSYLVGERGPELFVPGAQGNIVPNNAVGGVNVGTINISVENTGDQLNPQAQKQIAGQVQSIVLSTLANERRSGGML